MIIIGDIHGDLDALINSLLVAKVIVIPDGVSVPKPVERTNKTMYDFFHKIEWIGDDTFVIQVGDQIDRTRPVDWDENDVGIGKTVNDEGSSLHIFFLMWYLNCIARENGGRVISLLGNHELMNVEGDFRYVSPFEFQEYANSFKDDAFSINNDTTGAEPSKKQAGLFGSKDVPPGYNERTMAFTPGNIISNYFGLNYKLIIQVGKWLFTHAGLTENVCQPYSICKINNSVSRYLLNKNSGNSKLIYKQLIECSGSKSCVWNRDYGDATLNDNNTNLKTRFEELLNKFNNTNKKYHEKNEIPKAEYIAIGHTPQFYNNQKINSVLDGKVWRCDVGMSRAFGPIGDNQYRMPQVLEILDDDIVNVLS